MPTYVSQDLCNQEPDDKSSSEQCLEKVWDVRRDLGKEETDKLQFYGQND